MSTDRWQAAFLGLLALAACSSDPDPIIEEELPTLPPAALSIDTVVRLLVRAGPYQGLPGWQLDEPLQVRVQATDGTPIEGVTVEWGSATPGAHFPATSSFLSFPGIGRDVTVGRSVSGPDGIASVAYAPGFVRGLTFVDAVIPGSRVTLGVQVGTARDMKEVAGANKRWCGIDAAGVLFLLGTRHR